MRVSPTLGMRFCAVRGVLIGISLFCAASKIGAMSGSVNEGRYFSKDRKVSCEMPSIGPGRHIDEHFERGTFILTFWDDFGQMYRIDGITTALPADLMKLDRQARLKRFAQLETYPLLAQAGPGLQILGEEWIPQKLDGCLVALALLPHGSVLHPRGGERFASVRKIVLFETPTGALIQVSYHGPELPAQTSPANSTDQKAVAKEMDELLRFAATVKCR